MIYTIGHEQVYLEAIADSPDGMIQKMGRRGPCKQFPDGYEGGYAFQSIEDAQRRIDLEYPTRDFVVFGMRANWETDTEPNREDGWWHNLLNDAEIVRLSVKHFVTGSRDNSGA